jgi:hypothetical protein
MKTWNQLSINQKLTIKQRGMDLYGKRYHANKPNFWKKLNEIDIQLLLSR